MTQSVYYFILQFLAHCSKIGIVARDSNEQVPVVRGIFLGILQHRRIQHVDLESGAPVLDIPLEECFEFLPVLWILDHGWVEGHGVAGSVWKAVEIIQPVAVTVRSLAAQNLAHRVGIRRGALDVGTV